MPLEVLQTGVELTPGHGAADISVAPEVLALIEHDPTFSVSRAFPVLVIVAIAVAAVPVAIVAVAIIAAVLS